MILNVTEGCPLTLPWSSIFYPLDEWEDAANIAFPLALLPVISGYHQKKEDLNMSAGFLQVCWNNSSGTMFLKSPRCNPSCWNSESWGEVPALKVLPSGDRTSFVLLCRYSFCGTEIFSINSVFVWFCFLVCCVNKTCTCLFWHQEHLVIWSV